MDENLKTSVWQRVVILVVAAILVASMIVAYIMIVLGGQNSTTNDTAELEEKTNELTARYDEKSKELEELAQPLGERYFDSFKEYLKSAKSYNSASANASGLAIEDIKTGTGKTLAEDDTDYLAYYVGWCPDGSIFSSSYDDTENPTALNAPIDPSNGLIEGWEQGVVGMKIGGVRQITMSGDLAYGDTQEICGATNSPLKFIVMPIERDEKIAELLNDISDIRMELLSIYYGASY